MPSNNKELAFPCIPGSFVIPVIVKSYYEEVIVVITRVRGRAEDKCNNNDNLQAHWNLTGFYPIVFDVRHVVQ